MANAEVPAFDDDKVISELWVGEPPTLAKAITRNGVKGLLIHGEFLTREQMETAVEILDDFERQKDPRMHDLRLRAEMEQETAKNESDFRKSVEGIEELMLEQVVKEESPDPIKALLRECSADERLDFYAWAVNGMQGGEGDMTKDLVRRLPVVHLQELMRWINDGMPDEE